MPRNLANSVFMKPFVVLALPGMYLFYKYNQYKQQQQEQCRRKVTERELAQLNHKIDKLLTKLEENEPEVATSQEDECVICVNAKATMQTSPCGHRVVCRKCFVKTIQMAVSQRLLPLRCVICRAKILRLKQSGARSWLLPNSASQYSVSGRSSSWSRGTPWVPSSASQYSMGSRSVPSSASMYSMTSGSSSLSGMSSVSSATNSSTTSKSSSTSQTGGCRQAPRQPTGSLRRSQQYSMKVRIQEYNEPRVAEDIEKPSRLPPIAEFQREYRLGKERAGSSSTRIRCAQKIVTQLETVPSPAAQKSTTPQELSTELRPSSSTSTTSSISSSSSMKIKSPLRPISSNIYNAAEAKLGATSTEKEPLIAKSRAKSSESIDRAKKREIKNEVKSEETHKSEKEEKKEVKAAKKEAKKEAKREAKKEKKAAKEREAKERKEAKEKEAREKREAKEKNKENKQSEGKEKVEKRETHL